MASGDPVIDAIGVGGLKIGPMQRGLVEDKLADRNTQSVCTDFTYRAKIAQLSSCRSQDLDNFLAAVRTA